MSVDFRAIPDEDLEELVAQAREMFAEQQSGFGYSERTMSWARQIYAEYNRRYRQRANAAQNRI